jgi:hypothetical protein
MSCVLSRWRAAAIFVAVMVGTFGVSQAQVQPLTITTESLPSTMVGSTVNLTLAATGGALPLAWQVREGKLPPGLKLNASSGLIAGKPTVPGEYRFTLSVTDSSAPAMQVQRLFTLVITAAVTIDWKQPPAVHGQAIEGSVLVANHTERDFTLTVIVMAVNEISRATALGYQEFTLKSGAEQVIPFGSSPGPGTYVVHADAVAEVESTNSIYRARKQTTESLVIQSPQ